MKTDVAVSEVKDTVLSHLCHEIIVVKEEEADHCDDEEGSTSGLCRVKDMN